MTNVLGGAVDDLPSALLHCFARDRRLRVQLYGKQVRPGRKVGHVTAYGDDLDHVRERARHAAAYLMGDPMPEQTRPGGDRDGLGLGLAGDERGRRRAGRSSRSAYEADVVSAHRMPDAMIDYGRTAARAAGSQVIIAGAGGAAHLPGMLAAVTPLPVIGVPVPLKYLDGMDSLLSIVQMPAGVPVATVAIGNARNAGLLAVRILAAGRSGAAAADGRVPGSAAAGRGGQGRGRPRSRQA